MKIFFQLSEQALVWKINLMARKPWETELGSGQDWSSSNIAAFRCIEKLDKLVSTSEKYYFYIGWTVHRGFCASFPSVFPILQMKTECIGTMEFFSELKDQYISMWALPLFFFCYFSSTDSLDTLNLVVACAAINIWQGSLLKESHYCVMTKLKTAQMEKIKVAGVTLRHFLSAPCFALQTGLFILIWHLYVRKLQDFKTANRTTS